MIFIIPRKISKEMIKQRIGFMWFWDAYSGGLPKIQKPYVAEELISILKLLLEKGDVSLLHKNIDIEYEK